MSKKVNSISPGLLVLIFCFVLSGTSIGSNESRLAPRYLTDKKCVVCHGQKKIFQSKKECILCHQDEAEHKEGDFLISQVAYPKNEKLSKKNMVLIPQGEFIMGNDGRRGGEGSGDLDETPAHKAYTDSYYIDIYEVTNADYKEFVEKTNRQEPYHWKKGKMPVALANHPVVYVNWKDSDNFCRWNGKHLPTEAQWEKAARGPNGRFYPWGDEFDAFKANTPQRWLTLDEKGRTMPVGSFEAGKSPYGLYDMSGNVWEWTASWYTRYAGNKYPKTSYGKKYKVLKGGSWYNCMSYGCGLSAVASNRSEISPRIRNNSFGFRCAIPLKDPRPL